MRRLLAAVVAAAVLSACGGASRPQAAKPRPIGAAQALELARVLVGDRTHAGSRVTGTYTVQGQLLDFTGAIDFRSDAGRLSLHEPSLPQESARKFYWTRTLLLAEAKPGSSDYDVASVSSQGDPVDRLVELLGLLSAPAIDNIQQLESSDILYLGSATGIDRFRYGRIVLSVRHSSDLLADVALDAADGSRITVELLTHGPQRIVLPPRSRWRFSKR